MTTLCKTEWVTGCHNCPQNGDCELQKVVAALGLTHIKYSALARKFDPETYDPFYDRDYNLCILCGRCIRACQEYRLAEVLSFQHRGPFTKVGTAFERSHLEANCEFCGSCVTVCPTGALAEKTRKWLGAAEKEVQTTCSFCGLGCQIQLQVKGNEVIGSVPINHHQDTLEQLCIKGRFAVYEVLNQPQRLTRPYLWENGVKHFLTPAEALQIAAEKLAECPPHLFGLALSADCTNEELYIARKFSQQVMNSPNIENLSRFAYGNSLHQYIHYLNHQADWESLENAQVVFSIGFDGRYNQSIIGSKIKRAIQKGAILITLYPGSHHLARHASIWINPQVGEEHLSLHSLIAALKQHSPTLEANLINQTTDILRTHAKRVLLIGNQFLHQENSALIYNAIEELLQTLPFATLTFPLQANLLGSLWLQTFSEFQSNSLINSLHRQEESPHASWILKLAHLQESDELPNYKVLYYLNTAPHPAFQQAEFTICQHISELEYLPSPALMLPAAAFAEMDGSLLDGFGKYQIIQKAVQPQGEAQPAWQWLCQIAQQIGKSGFDFSAIEEVQKELQQEFRIFKSHTDENGSASLPWQTILNSFINHPTKKFSSFYPYTDENIYLGVPLRKWVGGIDDLYRAQENEVLDV